MASRGGMPPHAPSRWVLIRTQAAKFWPQHFPIVCYGPITTHSNGTALSPEVEVHRCDPPLQCSTPFVIPCECRCSWWSGGQCCFSLVWIVGHIYLLESMIQFWINGWSSTSSSYNFGKSHQEWSFSLVTVSVFVSRKTRWRQFPR